MIHITAKEMLEEAQKRSNRIDYDKIASAETIIQTIIKSEFETTGTTCFDIGYRNEDSVTPYEIYYYSKGMAYLSKPEWNILVKEIQDAGFCVKYEDRKSTLDNGGYVTITVRF